MGPPDIQAHSSRSGIPGKIEVNLGFMDKLIQVLLTLKTLSRSKSTSRSSIHRTAVPTIYIGRKNHSNPDRGLLIRSIDHRLVLLRQTSKLRFHRVQRNARKYFREEESGRRSKISSPHIPSNPGSLRNTDLISQALVENFTENSRVAAEIF